MMISEEQIKKDLTDQLYWDDRVDAADVKLDINKGMVRMFGNVPNYLAKEAASEDAWITNGVVSVNNELKVRFPETVTVPTDTKIKDRVENVLLLSSSVDSSDIDIDVDAGLVTLEGSVDSFWKKLKAEELALDIEGVVDVINKLSIVPTKEFYDKDIAEDIIQAMTRNALVDPERIDVKVEDGMVTLSGSVPDWVSYQAAMDVVKYTAGVIGINDNLTIV